MNLRDRLKKYPLFRATNARVKATLLLLQRARLHSSYERKARNAGIEYDASRVPAKVAAGLRERGMEPSAWPERPGVLWVGADRVQDEGGFLQALARNSELTCFHRPGGEYGLRLKGDDGTIRRRDAAVTAENDAQLVHLVEERLRSGPPLHVVLGQMWAQHVSSSALDRVRTLGVATVNVSMDDRLPTHWIDHDGDGYRSGAIGIGSGVDLTLTTSPETCLWFEVEGCPSIWWPLASDPGTFAPAPEDEKVHDISFVGNRYGIRAEIVGALEKAGISVAAFGGGWPNGPITADRVARTFAESRMILGIGTVAHNRSLYTLKLRDFDAPMSGALYITHRNPDLMPLFAEGEEIEHYETADELVDKVTHYLANPERRIALARRGRERAIREHTWDARFAELFDVLRGTASPRVVTGG